MLQKMKYFAVSTALVVALGIFFERPAHAYVDAGSSLLVFQSISAMCTGILFYSRRRIKALFLRSARKQSTTPGSVL